MSNDISQYPTKLKYKEEDLEPEQKEGLQEVEDAVKKSKRYFLSP